MHAQGDPKTMNDNPQYSDVVLDVFDFLESRIAACEAAGIPRSKLVADPGIGFGKHLHHNVAVLAQPGALSRARRAGAARRLPQEAHRPHLRRARCRTTACRARSQRRLPAVAQGVQIVRVHDVAATRQALSVWQAIAHGTDEGAHQ